MLVFLEDGMLIVFGGLGLIYATFKKTKAVRKELSTGYTTLFGREYAAYWQLDPKTGEVLRRPGEPDVRRRPKG
ncbi:MAG: hypothetical protein ACYDAK_06080 [Candidatus Limnocylindrales bacterium]